MRKGFELTMMAAGLAVSVFAVSPAQAGLDACGDIHVEAEAECTAEVTGGCDVTCQNLEFTAACSAEGYVKCSDAECDLPSVSCSGSCEADCSAECKGGSFDCGVHCQGKCDGNCDSECSASGNKAECKAQCQATCKGECDASCSANPPECSGKCKASCQGQCKAKTNMSCQVKCQGKLNAACETKLKGGCKARCESPEGIVTCDGQYVDHNGNGKACLDAITAWTAKIDAHADASGSASCANGKCTAEAEASAGCGSTVADGTTDGSAPYAIGLLGALGALVFGRLRRRG